MSSINIFNDCLYNRLSFVCTLIRTQACYRKAVNDELKTTASFALHTRSLCQLSLNEWHLNYMNWHDLIIKSIEIKSIVEQQQHNWYWHSLTIGRNRMNLLQYLFFFLEKDKRAFSSSELWRRSVHLRSDKFSGDVLGFCRMNMVQTSSINSQTRSPAEVLTHGGNMRPFLSICKFL